MKLDSDWKKKELEAGNPASASAGFELWAKNEDWMASFDENNWWNRCEFTHGDRHEHCLQSSRQRHPNKKNVYLWDGQDGNAMDMVIYVL